MGRAECRSGRHVLVFYSLRSLQSRERHGRGFEVRNSGIGVLNDESALYPQLLAKLKSGKYTTRRRGALNPIPDESSAGWD